MLPVVTGSLLVVAGLLLATAWLVNAPPARVIKVLKYGAVFSVFGLIGFLVAAGKVVAAIGALIFLAPMIARAVGAIRVLRSATQRSGDRTSTVRTTHLEMVLDHSTGRLNGVVQTGPFAGRSLDDLSEESLKELATEIKDDAQSITVLTTYLDRRFGPDWRIRFGRTGSEDPAGTKHFSSEMSEAEAWLLLGLEPGASQEAIRSAHRTLMKRVHPDAGGDSALAARLNEAKDLLLAKTA